MRGIINHLDYLEKLGITALWLNSVQTNDQPKESYHGYAFTEHYRIDPRFGIQGNIDPVALFAPDAELERLYGGGRTTVGSASEGDLEARIDADALGDDIQQLKDLASEAPVIRLVSLIITNALETRASDIHIEPFENRLIVRYRGWLEPEPHLRWRLVPGLESGRLEDRLLVLPDRQLRHLRHERGRLQSDQSHQESPIR